jgi:phosphoribosyl 1,2-cyclic phosphodiesterase
MKFISYASGSTGNMYEVTDGTIRILLECGIPIKEMQRLTGHTLSQFDACFYTHKHLDHCKGFDGAEKIGINPMSGSAISGISCFIHPPKTDSRIEVRSFPVPHDVENYGFIFRSFQDNETLLFITDAFYCPATFDFSPTIIAIEANYSHDLITPDCPYSDRLIQST